MMDLDDSAEMDLTRTDGVDETDPSWMLDDQHIVFVSDRDGNKEIYLMSTDGSNLVRLTYNLAEDRYPHPSPDGKRIAFLSDRNGNRNLFIMDIDGSHQINFPGIVSKNVCTAFSWSPDGRRITFATEGTHTNDLYMIHRDGSGRVKLTDYRGGCPDKLTWSLGVSKIAYASKYEGNWKIYLVQITKQIPNPVRLTYNHGDDVQPEWEPIPLFEP